MKGTASIQLTLDYLDEEDYARKFQVTCYLSPLLAILTDNSPIFEGQRYTKHALRTKIWLNCDDDRCGIIPHAFDGDFSYATYAQYIFGLDHPSLLLVKGSFAAPKTSRSKRSSILMSTQIRSWSRC